MAEFSKYCAAGLALYLGACGEPTVERQEPPTPQSQAIVVEDTTLKPAPGAKLSGPVPKPVKQKAKPGSPAAMDLGSDRPVVKVDAPRPPRGSAIAFTFGD